MEVKKILVVGAGTMGHGIAQLVAQQGFEAYLVDREKEIVEKAFLKIKEGLMKRVEKGKISKEEAEKVLEKITVGTDMETFADADFVIEAVFEDVEVKKKVFEKLDKIFEPEVVLATNTTACSISEIATATRNRKRVIGMHFFNPPVIMKLVEIIPGLETDETTVEKTKAMALMLDKTPVVTKIETPAGIVSRVLAALLNEAVVVYSEGVADAKDIDTAMKLGANLPMGPLELIDMIGVDIHLAKTETLYREYGDPRYRPPYILKKMVKAGHLGRKTGRGFYIYEQ
ncbi:3-hydroxyacyl-CoA dehydrogenase family protein [Thermovenabulum gondwanense]|uniref:3-hydroxybutyryl-CoA dehydrogenase n=1 Tax=Thermovenabulum gondwanense TaxID=520767 RepID=A0A162M862_9FIRM|nr:3-hydroxyacyl-CoA dehydrogenase NAD-binding domain-containing protein [Thermovenabulum gondwanense]KYO64506.1 3-hydroxybutyryl-CoA dehydrogenase [Thermovenabulum gondwanense]